MSVSPHPPSSVTPNQTDPEDGITISDEVIRGLVDAAPDGLLMVDDAGVIQLLNRRAEQMFGYDRGELVGRTVEELVPERVRELHRAHRRGYLTAPAVRPMGQGDLLQGRRGDGSEFPVEISLSPLDTPDGQRTVAIVREVTARVAAETQAAVIRHAIDQAADGIFVCDEKTLEFSWVNMSAGDMFNYSSAELIGMNPTHLADLDTAELEALIAPLIGGEVGSVELTTTGIRRDGAEFPVEVNINHPPASGPGAPRPIVAVVRDVSERLEAAERVARAEQRASVLADRERLARDLHDTIIQELFALGLDVQSSVSRVKDPAVAERLHDNVDDIDAIIRSIRTTIFGLTSRNDWGHGPRGRILELAAEARSSLGFEPSVTFRGELDSLPEAVAEELVPTLNEALSNVAKHASASRVVVDVTVADGGVTLTVDDDGVGVPEGARESGGFGLDNMVRRAELVGGACVIEGSPLGGTSVSWHAPLGG